jgi:hypothetical protein
MALCDAGATVYTLQTWCLSVCSSHTFADYGQGSRCRGPGEVPQPFTHPVWMRDVVWGQTVRSAGQTGCIGHDGRAKPASAARTGPTVSEGHGYPLVLNKVQISSLVKIMSIRRQKELTVIEGNTCNYSHLTWKLASHTMATKVSTITSWVLVHLLPWAQGKKWILIGSMGCVHMH